MWVTRDVTMVTSPLLLLNHFLMALAHNSPAGSSHPNAIGGIYTTKRGGLRPVVPSLVSYEVVGSDSQQNNYISRSCSVGCASCSPVNGCLACRPPFLLTLRREGARQIPSCLPNCPPGFYKTRVNTYRVCASCSVTGCRVCRRDLRCSVCDDHHYKDGESGHCVRITEGMEAIKQKNDASVSSLVATERNVSSRRGLRKRRRKKGRKFSAGRRRRLRGRRPRKLRGRGNRRKKLRKHRKPNPAENEVAVDAESISQVSLKGSTSLNHGQGRYRKLHNRRRSRKRRGRRRRKRVSLRVEVGFGEGKMGSSEVFFSRESSQNSILAWHRDRPQVSLARPSRHIHNGLHNATRAMPKTTLLTHTIDNNATRVTHTSDNNATHLTHTIDNNATHLTHTIDNNAYFPTHSKQSNIPSFGSPTAPQNDMKVSPVSGRDTDKTSLHRTHGNRTNVNKDTGQPALCLMNLLGHSSLEDALFIKSGKSPFKLDSRRTYINETADTMRSETQQIDQNAEVEEERKRLLVKEARTRRRHHRRLGKRKLRNTQ